MTDIDKSCRKLAEQIWDAMTDAEVGDNAVATIADAIRNHTAYPDVLGALEEAQTALSGDKRQRADNALAKAGRK